MLRYSAQTYDIQALLSTHDHMVSANNIDAPFAEQVWRSLRLPCAVLTLRWSCTSYTRVRQCHAKEIPRYDKISNLKDVCPRRFADWAGKGGSGHEELCGSCRARLGIHIRPAVRDRLNRPPMHVATYRVKTVGPQPTSTYSYSYRCIGASRAHIKLQECAWLATMLQR